MNDFLKTPKISAQHGLEARRLRENELHSGIGAWDRTAGTFGTLVAGHNELLKQLTWLYNEVLNLQEVVRSLGGVVE